MLPHNQTVAGTGVLWIATICFKVCRRAHQPISPDRQGDRNDVVVGLSLEGTTKRKGLACGLAVYCRKRACLVPCSATVTRSRGGVVQQNRFMQTPLELSGLKADCIEIVRN